MPEFKIGSRWVGDGHPPLVIAEAGINHSGELWRAHALIEQAHRSGAEAIKFQCHVPHAEMLQECAAWDAVSEAELTLQSDLELRARADGLDMMYLSTPFSLLAVARVDRLGVPAIKIGSGECSNLPLIQCAALTGRPIILSTGMHGMDAIADAVAILRETGVPYALLHCTSEYPTRYENVRLGALAELRGAFPDAVIGLSCHSLGIYTALAAVALGASIIEKHFTVDRRWPGPDQAVSIEPSELRDLVIGARAVHAAMGGTKEPLPCEAETAAFAMHSVVSVCSIEPGQAISYTNTTVKRPAGGIPAKNWGATLGRVAAVRIPAASLIRPEHLE